MPDRVGQQLGNYQLAHLLGQGGFADVYLGEHLHLGTQAAIKVLHTHLPQEDWETARKEARIIAGLVHPHIVRVLDFDVTNGTPFLVMAYAPNGTLRRRHPKGVPLLPTTILPYVSQVAGALQYIHARKLVHRDVKPENLLLGVQNEVLLSDFGVAIIAQSSRQSNIQAIGGTVAYMAPEQIQSKPCAASDQYSLAVVVYEWLTGTRPFEGAFTEIATKQLLVAPPPLHERVPTLSPAVEAVVLRALAKEPAQRYLNVQEFAEALEGATLGGQPTLLKTWPIAPADLAPDSLVPASALRLATDKTSAAEESLNTQALVSSLAPVTDRLAPSPAISSSAPTEKLARPQSQERRFPRRAILGGLAWLAAAAGGISWLALSRKSPTVVRPGPTPTSTRPPTPTLVPGSALLTYRGHSNPVYAVAWSPDGKKIASAAGAGNQDQGQFDHSVQVWDALTGTTLRIYQGHTASVIGLAWSPDNKWLASASYDGTVQVWDAVAGGRPRLTYRGHTIQGQPTQVWDVAWSPDGNYLASCGEDTTVQIWDAATGAHLFTYRQHTGGVSALAWSPNSALMLSASYDKTVHIWEALSGTNRLIYRGHADEVRTVVWSPDGKQVASGGGNKDVQFLKDHTVQVWEAATGKKLLTYSDHPEAIFIVAWSPIGNRLASGGLDNAVRVWDGATGQTFFTYGAHDLVESLSWSPDGTRLVSGCDDMTAQVWATG